MAHPTRVVSSADGVPILFDVAGASARAIVFVHGWSCDRTYWREQVGHFADRYRVVAIDLAGHGASGDGRVAWTMPAFGEDVVAAVEALELDGLVLVGHSMGGDVIVEAALRLPGRVSGLVWVDVYRTLGARGTAFDIEEFMRPFRDDFVPSTRNFVRSMFTTDADPELVEWIAADMSSAPPEIALDAMRHALGNEDAVVAGLRELRVRVVALNPDYRPTDEEALGRHGVETVLMPGVGHFPMLEAPAAFNRMLDGRFDELFD